MRIITRLCMIMITFTLAACGGGGGGGDDNTSLTNKTSVVMKIGSSGVPSAAVKAVGLTLTLPLGVTIATDANGNVPLSAANVSGVAQGWGLISTYNPADSATTHATLTMVSTLGANTFQTGEMFTVTCNLPVDNTLSTADFTSAIITSFNPSDSNLQRVTGLTPTLSLTIN